MPNWISYSLLLGIALKSTAVLGVASLVVFFLRAKSAAVRHTVWSAAFAAILVLPLLSVSLPALLVPIDGSLLTPGFIVRTNSSASIQAPASSVGRQGTIAPLLKTGPWSEWPKWLMLIWATGTAISLAQMLIGWTAIRRLQRRAKPVTILEIASLTELLGIRERVSLFKAPRGSMPITFGLFHTAIFLPAEILEWSAERRRMVLLHELAHVRRGDSVIHLLARTALSLYWWNPLAWTVWREFLKERERAADDLVLNAGGCASEYASHLLEIARSMQLSPAAGCAAVPMARRSQLEGRLLAILDSSRNRRTLPRLSPMVTSLVAVGMMAPLAAVQGQSETGQTPVTSSINSNSFRGMIQSGDMAREQGKFDEAKILYQKAQAASASGSETALALIHLGIIELATKNAAQAINDFEQAQRADSGQAAVAEMWMAIGQQSQKNLEAADGFYQNALAAEDPNSAAAATTMELYAQLLREKGDGEKAKTIQEQAAAVRKEQAAQALSRSQISSPDVYRIGGDVKAPTLVSKEEPQYTQEARIAKYQGSALLSIEIGVDGSVHNIRIIRALGFGLDEKAIAAVTRWKFKPSTKNEQTVAVSAQVEVNFRLL